MEEKVSSGKGFGITSLITGILSIVLLRFIIFSVGFAIVSIVFGILAKRKGEKTFSKAGIALGIVSLSVTLLLFLFLEVLDVSLFFVPSWYN